MSMTRRRFLVVMGSGVVGAATAQAMPMRPMTLVRLCLANSNRRELFMVEPSRNSTAARIRMRRTIRHGGRPFAFELAYEYGKLTPAMKRKSGKIVS